MKKLICFTALCGWLGIGQSKPMTPPKNIISFELIMISEPGGKRFQVGEEPHGQYHLEAKLKAPGFLRVFAMNSAGQPFPLSSPQKAEAGKPFIVQSSSQPLSFEVGAKNQGRGGGTVFCLLALATEKEFDAVPLNWDYLEKNGKRVNQEK